MQQKADGTALTVTAQENVIKKTLDKRFAIPLDFDFFKHPVCPYDLKECLFIRLELNSAGKVLLCMGDTNATYKISDIYLEYEAIFNEPSATMIREMYTGTTSIPYTKVTLIHYKSLKKKTTWKIDVNNLLLDRCRVYCYYSLTNVKIFRTNIKNFIIQALINFW